MAQKKPEAVLVRKNVLLILFALVIVLFILSACLAGVVVSEKRANKNEDIAIIPSESVSDSIPNVSNSDVPTSNSVSQSGVSLPAVTSAGSQDVLGDYTVNTSAENLNMRQTPGIDGNIITQIPRGTKLTVTAVENGWGYVSYRGHSGWVSLTYLVAVPNTSVAAGMSYTVTVSSSAIN